MEQKISKREEGVGIGRNIVQGAEIVGGIVIGLIYMAIHSDQAMPEGGWREISIPEPDTAKGSERVGAGKKVRLLRR